MEDRQLAIETDLQGLDQNTWLGAIDDVFEEFGFFEQLGRSHCAGFLEAGNNLFVTFENVQTVQAHNIDAEPRGFAYARHEGWSHLGVYSFGESWFRDDAVLDFFERMVDDGFFDDFENVLFHGADGGAAYAAAALSATAPGATVIALRPQATLNAQIAGWDPRYRDHRKQDFSGRFGYAPDMIDGAKSVFVAYDSTNALDAGHAALFHKTHVTSLPCPLMGAHLDQTFDRLGIHDAMIKLAMDGSLDRKRFVQLQRARRYDTIYARALTHHLIKTGHSNLAKVICEYMLQRRESTYFRALLGELTFR